MQQTFSSLCGVGSPGLWAFTKGTKGATSNLPASFLCWQPCLHGCTVSDLTVVSGVGSQLEPRLLTVGR